MAFAPFAQHFLTNPQAIERIVAALDIHAGDSVLEIGPGKGALTRPLLNTGAHIISIEIDKRLVEFLKGKFPAHPRLQLIQGDVLKYPFIDLPPVSDGKNGFKVAGNLPYNITSPILRRLSEWDKWEFAVIMVQKEVGDRLCASPNDSDYGALTVGVSLTCSVAHIFDLSEGSFSPPPRVKSSVLKITRLHKPLTDNISQTQKVIQAAFQQRRKTILNSLSHGLGLDKAKVGQVLQDLGIDPIRRAETLAVDQFIQLSGRLY